MLSLDVEPKIRELLRERAAAAGVSMAEYVSVALAQQDRVFATASAEIAQPLVQLSYRISRAQHATTAGDDSAVAAELELARRLVAEAMRPLAAPHAEEVRSGDRRRAGGWSG
ncbi:MAG: hypothetical protein PXZ07_05345 [Candidatus Eremiobacteraeota bacterium]|nr:hypothetical protein [Candidatus Eremiobacteraeota bacterium]